MNATEWEQKRIAAVADRVHADIKEHLIERHDHPKVVIVPRGLLPDSVEMLWGLPVVREDEVIHYRQKEAVHGS